MSDPLWDLLMSTRRARINLHRMSKNVSHEVRSASQLNYARCTVLVETRYWTGKLGSCCFFFLFFFPYRFYLSYCMVEETLGITFHFNFPSPLPLIVYFLHFFLCTMQSILHLVWFPFFGGPDLRHLNSNRNRNNKDRDRSTNKRKEKQKHNNN